MEVESVVRDVCDMVLSEVPLDATVTTTGSGASAATASAAIAPALPKHIVKRRAEALRTIGKIFEAVKGDGTREQLKEQLFGRK